MSKSGNYTENVIKEELKRLEAEELRLFHLYNRHAPYNVKITLLNELIAVIHEIALLNRILK